MKKKEHEVLLPRGGEPERLEYRTYKFWLGVFKCNCGLCSGNAYGWGPKQKNRRERQNGKKQTRTWGE